MMMVLETVNRPFKVFGILNKRFKNERNKHGICFEAIVALTQLEFQNGSPPCQVQDCCDPLDEDLRSV